MSEIFSTYEYVVAQKAEGRFLARRIGLILLYIFYAIGFLTVGIITRLGIPMVALVPVTLWIIIFFTWRYAKVEYEYSMTSGVVTFSEIYGGRSRKKMMEARIKNAVKIVPLEGNGTEAQVSSFAPEEVYSAVPSKEAKDVYVMLYTTEQGKKCAFTFVATEQALRIMKYYNNAATTVTPTER